jgi:hypothetical protein
MKLRGKRLFHATATSTMQRFRRGILRIARRDTAVKLAQGSVCQLGL